MATDRGSGKGGQPPGPGFRAAAVAHRCDGTTDELRCDLAAAYPPEAGLTRWLRTFRLVRGADDDERIEIGDAWDCSAPPGSLALHLLAGGDVALANGGGRAVVSPSAGHVG
ncbi:hypothetical protein [Streptomyces rapamycinicus]|uniref:Uncharacterized protein n=1 Tax=Streptomyces rapamycinicus TaxID=1226757 RepID=A0ABR6M0J8_9ACTN|nr:hypothetical protein [Streptomyces rapamycinicus]AGP61431.1 hypothetical protein M271_50370 [Streptomyces rapamycinicus NRRL 5491]MBB4787383.1 hypothetical protein [Streptomyces rapamycinicus]UTP36886.1 hypothetical protein LIV37_51370 [Streptomyces rapamycinicus NRRL 5491]